MYILKTYLHFNFISIGWKNIYIPKVIEGQQKSNILSGQIYLYVMISAYQISHQLIEKTTKGHQRLKWSPKVWTVTKDHQRSIFTFGQVCILKINLNTKFHINWLKKTPKSPKVTKSHQRLLNVKFIIWSNLSFGQICIHMIYLHMKFHINWLKNNQRSPKVIRGQFAYLVRHLFIIYTKIQKFTSIYWNIIKGHQRSPKVTKGQFEYLVICVYISVPSYQISHQMDENSLKVTKGHQ